VSLKRPLLSVLSSALLVSALGSCSGYRTEVERYYEGVIEKGRPPTELLCNKRKEDGLQASRNPQMLGYADLGLLTSFHVLRGRDDRSTVRLRFSTGKSALSRLPVARENGKTVFCPTGPLLGEIDHPTG
jgi:hypothetical protein